MGGLLSGTSADGIDVVLLRPAPGAAGVAEWLAFATRPFPPELAARVRAVLDGEPPTLAEVARLHRDLGRAFGSALAALAAEVELRPELAGSHGQTVWHHDGSEPSGPATLQLGDGDFVAEQAGCAVVSDFRQRDIARGGEGAPLIGAVDELLFPALAESAAAGRAAGVLNLGGMANLTLLARPGQPLLSFDTGPAGALLDGLARRLLGRPYDEGGRSAARGRVREQLVARLLDHPYYAAPPPKSTGRDTFGEAWLDALAPALAGCSAEDQLASAAAAVARGVVAALDRALARGPERVPEWASDAVARRPAAQLVLAGGGVHHRVLLAELAAALERSGHPAPRTAQAEGVDPDAREAAGFALLAARCVLGLPSAPGGDAGTGAAPGGSWGKLSPA